MQQETSPLTSQNSTTAVLEPAARPNFIEALQSTDCPIVMEVKMADADGNELLGGRSVAEVVADYEAAGAGCISVVTGKWFGGSFDLLAEVASLTDLPILQKDFITRRSQLVAAKENGASAVLLTLTLLTDAVAASLIDATLALGLTPFVECTTEEEIANVHRAPECVVAVNNKEIRNGEKGEGKIERSLELLPALTRSGAACRVSASGIADAETAAQLADAGYNGLLIGTTMMNTGSAVDFAADVAAHRTAAPVAA